jgi:hypothetical protein
MNMKAIVIIGMVCFSLYGCGSGSQNKESVAIEQPQQIEKNLELPDSLFFLKDQKTALIMKNFDFEEKFQAMDSIQMSKLFEGIPPFGQKGKEQEGYFVSLQNKVHGLRPILVYGATENYAALLILVLNDMNKVVGYKEVAGGFCAAPQQLKDRIQWCDEKMSTILNDSTFELVHVHQFSPSYERVNEKYLDSVKYVFKISSNGKFEQLKKDSARFHKVDKNK